MPRIKTYFSRDRVLQPGAAGGKDIEITEAGDVIQTLGLKRYIAGTFDFLAFDSCFTEPEAQIAIAPMIIPSFFNEVPVDPLSGVKNEIHGLFLVNIGASHDDAHAFVGDKGVGKYGCPKRLLRKANTNSGFGESADKFQYFTFNKMRFYPFVMTDFTIGYYSCDDTAKEPIKWPAYKSGEKGVSLNYPLTYDATLGIYLTRDATVVD